MFSDEAADFAVPDEAACSETGCLSDVTSDPSLFFFAVAFILFCSIFLFCASGIRTHILATPELESNALDRSATTLHIDNTRVK